MWWACLFLCLFKKVGRVTIAQRGHTIQMFEREATAVDSHRDEANRAEIPSLLELLDIKRRAASPNWECSLRPEPANIPEAVGAALQSFHCHGLSPLSHGAAMVD